MVDLGQSAAPWPVSDNQLNLESQQPYIDDQVPPFLATAELRSEPANDIGFENWLMPQALDDW